MERFRVTAQETHLLESSHLVNELQSAASDVDVFPLLRGSDVVYFHDIDGGYIQDESLHLVNIIHRVQGKYSPPDKKFSENLEAHIRGKYYQMHVADMLFWDSYPDEDFIVSVKVDDYTIGDEGFDEALLSEIDRRETRHTLHE